MAPNIAPNSVWPAMLLLFVSAIFIPFARADCYSHDGVAALDSQYYSGPELVLCGKGINNCCFKGEKCGSNLLCATVDGGQSRQYCADKNWTNCSSLCHVAGNGLQECGNNIFCCIGLSDANCCSDGTGFFVDPATGDVMPASDGSSTASATFWSVDSSAALHTTMSSSGSPSTTCFPLVTSATVTAKTTTSSSSSTSTSFRRSSPTNQSFPPSSSSGLSAGVGIGIGIGCAVAVAGIAGFVWLFFRERKKRKSLQEAIYQRKMSEFKEEPESPIVSTKVYKAYTEYYGQGQQEMMQPDYVQQHRQELGGSTSHELD